LDYWLEKAAELLPEFEELITAEQPLPGPMALWIDLHYGLVRTYQKSPRNDDLIGRIYEFAAWCLAQPSAPDARADSDLSTAVAVAFIENLPLDRQVCEDLHRWMSLESFQGFESLFRYHLSEEKYKQFARDFIGRKKPSDPPARI
jgi:hypothetical protein